MIQINNFEPDYSKIDAAYHSLSTYVGHIASGALRSLIVNGPPGVGKSFMVKQYLSQTTKQSAKVVSGHITLMSLYHALHSHREPGQVLVLDDTDAVFSKTDGLNILKAAMDTQTTRNINWESSSHMLSALDLPTSFEFGGGVILITNIGFSSSSTSKLNVHLNALKDRSYCLQVGTNDRTGSFEMVAYMVVQKDMLAKYDLSDEQKSAILNYIFESLKTLTTVSLRTVIKIADLMKLEPKSWRSHADTALLTSK